MTKFRRFRRSLRRAHLAWVAGGVLALAAAIAVSPALQGFASKAARKAELTAAALPVTPDEWRGSIDYAALDARLKSITTDPSMTGLAVAVVEDGRIAFVRGYGVTSVEGGEPVDARTVFRWASLSKTVSGTLSARLAADGVFSLSEPLEDFHTSLRLPGDAQRSLTVEQLLSQQTGLSKNAYDGRLEDGQDPVMIRASLAAVKPVCLPGTCHSYQNVAYDTISEIIATRTGAPYAATVQRYLFTPLGMKSASFGIESLTGADHWAQPHRHGRLLTPSEAYYRVPAAAGVNSNIGDLAIWMQAQMGLRPDILAPAVLETAHAARVATARPYGRLPIARQLSHAGYGLGIRSFTYQGHPLLGHSGGVSGYRSTMMFDPATKTGIVMLWNSDSPLPFRFQAEFFDRVYGLPFSDWIEPALDPNAPPEPPAGEVAG